MLAASCERRRAGRAHGARSTPCQSGRGGCRGAGRGASAPHPMALPRRIRWESIGRTNLRCNDRERLRPRGMRGPHRAGRRSRRRRRGDHGELCFSATATLSGFLVLSSATQDGVFPLSPVDAEVLSADGSLVATKPGIIPSAESGPAIIIPNSAALDDGSIVLVWTNDGDKTLQAMRLTPSGDPMTPPVTLGGPALFPAALSLGSSVLLAWNRGHEARHELLHRRGHPRRGPEPRLLARRGAVAFEGVHHRVHVDGDRPVGEA